jgi:hypothetical protein
MTGEQVQSLLDRGEGQRSEFKQAAIKPSVSGTDIRPPRSGTLRRDPLVLVD